MIMIMNIIIINIIIRGEQGLSMEEDDSDSDFFLRTKIIMKIIFGTWIMELCFEEDISDLLRMKIIIRGRPYIT